MPLGKIFWVNFSVYAGISACLPICSFIGLLRKGSIVSHLWFEIAWLLIVSGCDGYLIQRQAKFWPEFEYYGKMYFDDPYLAVSIVSYVLAVMGLAIDIGLSLLWSGYLGITAWLNRSKYPTIWISHIQDFPWLLPGGSSDQFPGPVQLIFGAPRQTPPSKSIPAGLKRWFLGSTMFRRDSLEPISHSLLRGTVALALWVAVIAYAIINCVIKPIGQFALPKGLPSKLLLQDSHPMEKYGNITGFVALDVAPASQFAWEKENWPYTDEQTVAIQGGIRATVTDPSSGEGDLRLI
ncbi:hypothetical protein FRC01_012565 [Tulasnella sp. 417]|nr:hypothetical protein FRC01_012565 [Tulasnella sp. 417]